MPTRKKQLKARADAAAARRKGSVVKKSKRQAQEQSHRVDQKSSKTTHLLDRTSQRSESDASDSQDDQVSHGQLASDEEENYAPSNKEQLEALATTDPEFYKYLQETDQSLLDFDGGMDLSESSSADEQEEEQIDVQTHDGRDDQVDDDTYKPPATREIEQVDVSTEILKLWRSKLDHGVHRATLTQLVHAFRDAVRFGDESKENNDPERYIFHSAHTFNELMQYCLGRMDEILWSHVSGKKASIDGSRDRSLKIEYTTPEQQPHWRRHQPLVKSYLTQLTNFLDKLTEASMALVVLQQMHRMVPYLLVFPKLVPKALKAIIRSWGRESEAAEQESRLLAYAIVRRLVEESRQPLFGDAFKSLYITYARTSRGTTRASLPRIILMSSCIVNLAEMDVSATYQYGFIYIRQLAIHLRNATHETSDGALRQVYCWQFLNCLRLWAQLLCALARLPDALLRQLVFPLIQTIIGVARLRPNIRFAPIRFQCARMLNQMAYELGVFIPVSSILLETFSFAQLSKSPTGGKKVDRQIDWAVIVKVSNADSEKRLFQEGMVTQAVYLLGEHLYGLAYDIAFPEAAAPIVASLRAIAKKTKIVSLQYRLRNFVSQVEAHFDWILKARAKVDFSPRDTDKVSAFLGEERDGKMGPFVKWFTGEREAAEKREAEFRKGADAGARIEADESSVEEESEERSEEGKRKNKRVAKKNGSAHKAAAPSIEANADLEDVVETFEFSDSE